jgi:hypothetical protein
MRANRRPRRYVATRWLRLALPLFRYSTTRDAYVLRVIGHEHGPVLRADRRAVRRPREFDGVDRRHTTSARERTAA